MPNNFKIFFSNHCILKKLWVTIVLVLVSLNAICGEKSANKASYPTAAEKAMQEAFDVMFAQAEKLKNEFAAKHPPVNQLREDLTNLRENLTQKHNFYRQLNQSDPNYLTLKKQCATECAGIQAQIDDKRKVLEVLTSSGIGLLIEAHQTQSASNSKANTV